MHKAEFDQFVDYFSKVRTQPDTVISTLDHVYEHFGREFIFDLPTEYRDSRVGKYPAIRGTYWIHSPTGPAYCGLDRQLRFYILGYCLSLDNWLPRSALLPEEQLLYKLKYG
jgi:hypothetical protein